MGAAVQPDLPSWGAGGALSPQRGSAPQNQHFPLPGERPEHAEQLWWPQQDLGVSRPRVGLASGQGWDAAQPRRCRQVFLEPWATLRGRTLTPLSVSLFLTLCLPVCSALSLCLRLGVGSLTKPFTSSRTPMSSAMCTCLPQGLGAWLLRLRPQRCGCPVRGRGLGGVSGSGEVPEGGCCSSAAPNAGGLGGGKRSSGNRPRRGWPRRRSRGVRGLLGTAPRVEKCRERAGSPVSLDGRCLGERSRQRP